jgi:hypothetical protein
VTTQAEAKLSWRVSSSLESSRPGEVLMLDNQGDVVDGRAMRRAAWRNWSLLFGFTGATAALVGAMVASPAVGVLAATVGLGVMLRQSRHGHSLRQALVLASSGRRDQAAAAVGEIERRGVHPAYRAVVDYLAGKLAWQHGRYEDALGRFERVDSLLRKTRRPEDSGLYWICAFERAQLFAVMGRLPDARRVRAELEGSPRGEYFAMELALTDLMIAFHADAPDELPRDEDLFDWGKQMLRVSRFGANVALMAWAFEARGEPEMAKLCLRHASERIEFEFLADTVPKLHAWLGPKLEALPPEDEEL